MSKNEQIEINQDSLDVVESWLKEKKTTSEEQVQPVFEKRAQRLGLGAKYVPHKKVRLHVFFQSLARLFPKFVKKEYCSW